MGERKEKPLSLESAVQLDKRDVEELIKKEKEKEKEKGTENKEKDEKEVEEVEEKGNAESLPVILKKTKSSSFFYLILSSPLRVVILKVEEYVVCHFVEACMCFCFPKTLFFVTSFTQEISNSVDVD